MKILKSILLFLSVILIAHFTALYFGLFYNKLFPKVIGTGGIFMVPEEFGYYIVGIGISYLFFLPLLFTAFGNKHKYWWIGLLSLPALAFELYFDLSHIYIPIVLALLGWATGFGISKVLVKKN